MILGSEGNGLWDMSAISSMKCNIDFYYSASIITRLEFCHSSLVQSAILNALAIWIIRKLTTVIIMNSKRVYVCEIYIQIHTIQFIILLFCFWWSNKIFCFFSLYCYLLLKIVNRHWWKWNFFMELFLLFPF